MDEKTNNELEDQRQFYSQLLVEFVEKCTEFEVEYLYNFAVRRFGEKKKDFA